MINLINKANKIKVMKYNLMAHRIIRNYFH